MRTLIQRVNHASVTIDDTVKSHIKEGLLLFLGIEDFDNEDDIEWLCSKIINLRIFDDKSGIMNLSVNDINGEILVISQFTLHASTKKGNRPSYIKAAKPDIAIPLYEKFCNVLNQLSCNELQTGIFAADMKVALLNDGPVTIWIDSKNRE